MWRRYIATLLRHSASRVLALLLLLLAGGLTEGAGLLLLVPLLQLLGIGTAAQAPNEPALALLEQLFAAVGLALTLAGGLGAVFALIAVRALLVWLRELTLSHARLALIDALRLELHQALAGADWPLLSRLRGSDLHQALTDEVDRVGQGTQHLLNFIVTACMAAVYAAVALVLTPLLTTVALLAGGLLLLTGLPLLRRARRLGRQLSAAQRGLYAEVGQFLDSLKLSKSYLAEARQQAAFRAAVDRARERRLAFVHSSSGAQLLFQLGAALGLCTLVYGAVTLGLATAELLVLILIFARLMPLLARLLRGAQQLGHMLPAFATLSALQDRCLAAAEPLPPADDRWRPQLRRVLQLRQLRFAYPRRAAVLNGVDLSLPAGRITALVGASGAGKSTLADLLLGLRQPTDGQILIDGQPLTPARLRRWRAAVAYVPQEALLFNRSLRANLLWAKPDAGPQELRQALRLAAAESLLDALPDGLDTVLGERGLRLSGGERQRLMLARALLTRPQLLILDEATSAVDGPQAALIDQAVGRLRGELTVLVIAHRPATARRADRVAVLEAGRVIECGSWQRLSADPNSALNRLLAAELT